jgi:hypothetical protein
MTKNHEEDDGLKTAQISGEEYIKIAEIVIPFLNDKKSDDPPKFAIFMGGPGSGKTTIRRRDFSDYVNIEFGEIHTAMTKEFGADHPKLSIFASLACDTILRESLEDKKNIVIEIIGDNMEMIDPVIEKMMEIGYKISIQPVYCDISEARERHLKAVKEDENYLSVYFTEKPTLSIFWQRLGLGKMPSQP